MKIIEGMKKVKELEEKAADLRSKVNTYCADMDTETAVYPNQQDVVGAWIQSHHDIVKEISSIKLAIQKTNIATQVEVEVEPGKVVTKTIAEWIHRRRDLAPLEKEMWSVLGRKESRMKEGPIPTSSGSVVTAKIRRYYDPTQRDKMLEVFSQEPGRIDARLEVVNAVTDLLA